MKMEVCVDTLSSACNAARGGASRLELCASLMEGGLTPSCGFQIATKSSVDIPIYVMIRPRGGDFCYSQLEIQAMSDDIKHAKRNGMDGFVFGALDQKGDVDVPTCQQLLSVASPLPCTFHRAFDLTSDPVKALEEVISLGFQTLLTSGQGKTALEGLPMLSKLQELAAGRIILMPGCGINEENLEEILNGCEPEIFHASAWKWTESLTTGRKDQEATMGTASDFRWKTCDEFKVKRMIALASSIQCTKNIKKK